jgi:chloramphenicol 3-O-phosphotransferase
VRQTIWLINGIPGVGKTTTARALAMRLKKSVHIEGDAIQEMVISGLVYPGQEPLDESWLQLTLCIENQCLLARSFAEAGFAPVIDFVVATRERYDQYVGMLDGFNLRLVNLMPGKETALERDRMRAQKSVAHLWLHLEERMRADLSSVGLFIDNSTLTLDETVDKILATA